VPGKELWEMKFGQNLSQNGTEIRTFEPAADGVEIKIFVFNDLKCSSLDCYVLLIIRSRFSFAHRLQKVGSIVVGETRPKGTPDDGQETRTSFRVCA